MSHTNATTKLEAVNVLLAVIGQAPVSTLIGSGLGHANFAIQTIDEVGRRTQARGWHFNTEYDYPLTPNGSGNLVPPLNTLRIKQMEKHDGTYDLVYRDGKMYDKKNRTDIFTATDILFRVTLAFEFEKIPQALREYITIKAARTFQERILGSDTVHQFTIDDENEALMLVKDQDLENEDINLLETDTAFQVLNRWI